MVSCFDLIEGIIEAGGMDGLTSEYLIDFLGDAETCELFVHELNCFASTQLDVPSFDAYSRY